MKWAVLVNLSTTVRIVVLPSDGWRPVTKSRDIWIRAVRNGKRLEEEDIVLFWAHTMQAATNAETSGTKVGHQKGQGLYFKVHLQIQCPFA